MEAEKITISIFDANTVRRNVLIGRSRAAEPVRRQGGIWLYLTCRLGAYEFDIAGIYYRKHHEMFRWGRVCLDTDVFTVLAQAMGGPYGHHRRT